MYNNKIPIILRFDFINRVSKYRDIGSKLKFEKKTQTGQATANFNEDQNDSQLWLIALKVKPEGAEST